MLKGQRVLHDLCFREESKNDIASIFISTFITILISGQMIFLQRVILFRPLSDTANMAIIKSETKDNIKENIINPIICGKIPKKNKVANIKAIITPKAMLNKQLQIVLFISILLISYLYIILN